MLRFLWRRCNGSEGEQWEATLGSVIQDSLPPLLRSNNDDGMKRQVARDHMLAAPGEEARALQAVWPSAPAPRSRNISQDTGILRSCASRQRRKCQVSCGPYRHLRLGFERALRKRRAGCWLGPLDYLLLLFYRFSLHVLEQLSEIMARLILGLVPPTVITALHTGDITALAKWDDDVHGATFRRVDLRAGRSQETTIHGSRRRTAVWDWAQRRY